MPDSMISVSIGADDSEFRNKLSGLSGLAKNMLGPVATLAAGYFGFRSLVAGIRSVTEAFITQEKATAGVQAALRQQGGEWNRASKDIADFASELQKVTTYGDETTQQVMAMGMNMGISRSQIKEATRAAIGLASAYRMDLASAMKLLGRAANGSTEMLGRYGIHVDKAKSKQEQFSQAIRIGARNFSLAVADADTLGGRLAQLANAWGDLKEVIGEIVKNVFGLKKGAESLTETIQSVTSYLNERLAKIIMYGQKGVAVITFAFKYVWQVAKIALSAIAETVANVIATIEAQAKVAAENMQIIFANLPKLIKAVCLDMIDSFKNTFRLLVNLAANLGKAIWKAITGGGAGGFQEMLDQANEDLLNFYSNTRAALRELNLKELPEPVEIYDKTKTEMEKLGKLTDELANRFLAIDEEYANRLKEPEEKKSNGSGNGPDGSRKTDVVGSFSLRALSLMMGGGSPQQQTAQNTRSMLRELQNVKKTLQSGIETRTELAYGE